MRPEALSLYETLRASKELETIGVRSGELIINGVLPEEVCEIDFFKKKYEAQQKVIALTEEAIKKPKRYMFLRDNEVKGIDALTEIGRELFNGKRSYPQSTPGNIPTSVEFTTEKPDIDNLWLPRNGTKAIFFTGKGGVGKTTISCISALYISEKGYKTLLVTTDPAAHIGEVLDVKVGSEPVKITENLYAVMVDQEEAFRQYKERTLSKAKGKYSEEMLKAMEEELNSPCTEEMAAFDRFIQFIEGREYDAVVFDTAPTGHTLRLLDLPFDYAKQVEMMVGCAESDIKEAAENRFKTIINTLRDKRHTVFSIVLYPESTPILESYRAMLDLKEAGIETQLVIANMVLPEEVCRNDFFRNRRKMQIRYLKEIKIRFNLPMLQFPMLQEEIKGIGQLKQALINLQH